jgi:hypothetical protein
MFIFTLLLVCVLSVCFAEQYLQPKIGVVDGYNLLNTGKYGSKLYQLGVQTSSYANVTPYLLDLTSDPYQAGYDTGALMGKEFVKNIEALFTSLLGNEWYAKPVQSIMYNFLDKQYAFLAEQLPEEYKSEFAGMSAGGATLGLTGFEKDVGLIAQRALVLANFPGTMSNFKFIIEDEKKRAHQGGHKWEDALEKAVLKWVKNHRKGKGEGEGEGEGDNSPTGFQCSNFGVWGSRTADGELFTGRNLDWLKDTGVASYKLITVHHPANGNAHATFGFAGLWGAITGMSAKGLTVHEANLESDDISFYGFPWLLRLRHIMAYSQDLKSALSLWQSTNNTVGFNHGVGSAADGSAVLLETMAHNTAVFGAMDPREVNSPIGQPRSDAIFRTNHGYDQYTTEHYMWNNTNAYINSLTRYNLFPPALDYYESTGTKISIMQAVNITALAGEKGQENGAAYACNGPYPDGANILSATFAPKQREAYVAWESGTGDAAWTPAACSTYLEIDLNKFF